ncbi:hypothetical protein FPANT_7173 [Fusarium pseudoanthophilum]|uniref:Uncharacterized protein n=1 Tax=Fusarium pseudoanthophilum TaxID=48495 RepID=A0A8H5L893_9HYPO|nr:hypothetical protein FPANT_7173 [Fusarium pseudoanthophilum]
MSSALVTSLPIFADAGSSQTLVAEVLGADADHTTYVLNCPYVDPESEEAHTMDCGVYNNTYIIGPYMSKTLPPGAASTGDFDLFVTMPGDAEDDWKFSIHCEMSRTVATKCTTINIGGNNDGHPTATLTNTDDLEEYGFRTFDYGAVSITAGQELLDSKHASATATASDATKTKASGSDASGSETSGVATPTNTSGAASSFTRAFGVLSLAGVAAALVM